MLARGGAPDGADPRSRAVARRSRSSRGGSRPHRAGVVGGVVVVVEVFGVVRREHLLGRLDRPEAAQAVEDLEAKARHRGRRVAAAPGPTCRIAVLG
jgi:hypothetical protein